MSEARGTSLAPMILGIIGGVLGIPSALCSSLCAGIMAGAVVETGGSGGFYSVLSYLFLIAPIVGLVAGILAKRTPKKARFSPREVSHLGYFSSISSNSKSHS